MSLWLWSWPDGRPLLLIFLLWDCLWGQVLKPTQWPLVSGKPVLLAWNAPTEECAPRHGVHFGLDLFDIVASPSEGFVRQNLTIFYKERLGLYPYFESSGTPVNGGLPQTASLTKHLDAMNEGLKKYIRDSSIRGLAVIDWEEWRPLWIRNWDAKDIYRVKSRELVSQKNPKWTQEEVARVAQQEFEQSAHRFMLDTLRTAKSKRPNQLWGFYLFPDCYNHDYKGGLAGYTGRCPHVEMTRNDQLAWLWTESTALFPSVYMPAVLRSTPSGRQFVRNRVREGMRLAAVGEGLTRPVFVYTRPTYTNEMSLLTEVDLVSTIGESVALGAAGVIFWGDTAYASSNANCTNLSSYLQGPLGTYLLNVTTAAQHCSQSRCSSRGRCLRRLADADSYLHLNPQSFSLESTGRRLQVRGQLGAGDRETFKRDFQCQCYSGYQGDSCSREIGPPGASSSMGATWVSVMFSLLLLFLLH
ncbi:hyaluronidase-2-like [Brienomyrus brachyistius]|uniref:hyaluronidase-2-like n=1 Tax=Brienomyrus brachyistius TaxID=42636 RepID=UPI0020B37CB3|nr:hyaluronidase-2-like [Brienomyrus brachyistius]XP_048878867.1 hyaluronidase-2-like [Brienomyrus brachyistius]